LKNKDEKVTEKKKTRRTKAALEEVEKIIETESTKKPEY